MKKNILITGVPGVGKTTLIRKLEEKLRPLHPVGFYTGEIRQEGIRKGFELISFDGRRGLLSHIDVKSLRRVGKYKVDVKGFEEFLSTIPFLNPSIRLVMIDEIGKMECLSDQFKKLIKELLDSEKSVIATIAFKGSGLIEEVKKKPHVILFEITKGNRDLLLSEILKEVGPGVWSRGMAEEKIQVISYSGYRGEETPKTMIFRNERIEVKEILSRWVEEGLEDRRRRRFFKVKGSDGIIHEIFFSEKNAEWYHRPQGE